MAKHIVTAKICYLAYISGIMRDIRKTKGGGVMRLASKRSNGHLKSDWLKIKNAFSDTAADAKHKAREMIADSVDGIKEQSTKAKNKVTSYTAKRPFKSLGIALVAGAIIGLLIRRR